MQHQNTNLTSLLEAVSYAEYLVANHFQSHQLRGGASRDCRACQEHDAELDRAEAALRAFCARQEAA